MSCERRTLRVRLSQLYKLHIAKHKNPEENGGAKRRYSLLGFYFSFSAMI
jgi:hypothetical protein